MSICAVIENNVVINMIIANATDSSPDGEFLVEVPYDLPVMIGNTFVDNVFYTKDGLVVEPYPKELQEVIQEIEVIDEEATAVSDEIINLKAIE